MFFWISQGKVATAERWDGKLNLEAFDVKFSQDFTPKIISKIGYFWHSYSKLKFMDSFLGHSV